MKYAYVGLLALLLSVAGMAQAEDLVERNPALIALGESQPEALPAVLEEIARIQALPYQRGLLVPTEDNAEVFDLLQVNPDLADIHRRDPKATAKLLTIIRPQR